MNAVVVVNIGRAHLMRWALPSISAYCSRTGARFHPINEPRWSLGTHQGYNYGTFEKFQVYELFDTYERILRLDADVIVSPTCPNLFETDPHKVYAVREDRFSRKASRLKQMKLVQQTLGTLPEWTSGYVNSGVVLASREHRRAFRLRNAKKVLRMNLGEFKEQTMLNWRLRYLGFRVVDLGPAFNHMSMFDEHADREKAHILHYAGAHGPKAEAMRRDYTRLFGGSA